MCTTTHRVTDKANDHKVAGNVAFKRGRYDEAMAAYTEGLMHGGRRLVQVADATGWVAPIRGMGRVDAAGR